MDFMASSSYRNASRRPWQKSMDSQEFGFASNLMNSMEVAPADELFFKGQLLPLQMDPRLHLVQALSCEQSSSRRGAAPSRVSYWSQEEEVIEYNSCWLGGEDVPWDENKTAALAGDASDSILDHCPLLEHASSSEQALQGELSVFSLCKGKELLSCTVEGDMGLDNKASIRDHDSQPLDQGPLCDQDPRPTPQCGNRGSLCCKDEEINGPWLSYWSKDEEISFNSCRMEGNVDVDIKASVGNTMMDLRSSSFRSQNSGFWESGADKDTGDSSSSSRDSNGSSQDSYFPNNTTLETPSCATHSPHAKASFHILWKSLLRKASNKAISSSPSAISRMGYSEDLSKYQDCSTHSLREAKEAMLPPKLDSVPNAEKSRYNQDRKSKGKGINPSNNRSKSGFKSKSVLCNAAEEDVIAHMSTTMSKSLMSKGKGGRDVDEKEGMKRKQRSAAIKGRWQGYARRLRPLYVMKEGLVGQFRMDECGKRACEVENGNICMARTPVQRRLSHQISLFKSHKLTIQEQKQVCVHLQNKGSNLLAMSSCPPSARSSPNHSGALVVTEPKHKSTTTTSSTKKTNIAKEGCTATHANKNVKSTSNANPSSNYSSMSTMHELHSALQSAIAHCKESNKRLDCPA